MAKTVSEGGGSGLAKKRVFIPGRKPAKPPKGKTTSGKRIYRKKGN